MGLKKLNVPLPNGLTVYVEHQITNPELETIILINGALSTTTSFNHTVKFLKGRFNTLCFDLPYSGQSKPLNSQNVIITKDDEVEILCYLINFFNPDYLISISWGGVAALLALAQKRSSVKRAIIGSFSPFLNPAMLDYISAARDFIIAGDNSKAARLLNDTVGKFLPRMVRLYNYRYLSRLPEQEMQQVSFHIEQILALQPGRYLQKLQHIETEVMFINGELDEYTSAADVKFVAPYLKHASFATVAGAGHFLDLEGRAAQIATRKLIFDYFDPAANEGFETVQAM
ncbi:MAG: alpha/beta hydrolase [Verrucomicrobiaceae bacterium]|nr:alpha/beta hydrolase [Verrucomicrobiaceae bacterium]